MNDGEVKGDSAVQADLPEIVAIKRVRVSDLNPRCHYDGDVSSLVTSIGEGANLLQPIILRRIPDGGYEGIVGARRFKALKALRGEDGVLHAGEYRSVDWDDDQCVKAAVVENREREDLAPVDEGRFANALAERLQRQGKDHTDTVLEQKTGIDRSRISDLRALAEKFDLLPKSWREQLSVPANCRSGDSGEPTITSTHWKHVRGLIKKAIPSDSLFCYYFILIKSYIIPPMPGFGIGISFLSSGFST